MSVIGKLLAATTVAVFTVFIVAYTQAELSPAERDWVTQQAKIRYGSLTGFPPFESTSAESSHHGVTPSLLKQISDYSGLEFEIIPFANRAELNAAIKAEKIDIWSSLSGSYPPSALITDSYLQLGIKLYQREKSTPQTDDPSRQLIMIDAQLSPSQVSTLFPGYQLLVLPDAGTGLRMVSHGMADAILLTQAEAVHYIERHALTNLSLPQSTELELQMQLVMRSEMGPLQKIINQVLQELPLSVQSELYQRLIKLDYPKQLLSPLELNRLLWFFVILVVALLLIIILWQYRTIRTLYRKYQLSDERCRKLEYLSTVDPGTGISNRQAWLKRASSELERHHRYGNHFAVLLITIDGYKQVLKQLGDEAAENLFTHIVGVLSEELREHDLCGRMGGEQIAILVHGVDEKLAAEVVERVSNRVAETSFSYQEEVLPAIAIRAGIAKPGLENCAIEQLLETAETQLNL